MTIYVDTQGPELAAANVSASITSNQPILAERAMYSSRPGQIFAAGHAGAGVTAPALKWYSPKALPESFFDLFLLIANPGTQNADVKVTYLLDEGQPVVKTYTANRQSRLTIGVDFEDPRLSNVSMGMIVESTNGQPIVVERAMWWPSPDWHEAHLVAGSTATGTRWAVAGVNAFSTANLVVTEQETYILIANTSATAGTATLTLLTGGGTPIATTVPLKPNSRVSVPVGLTFNRTIGDTGVLVETDGVEVVVERATYSTYGGVPWAAGNATLGTRLEP